MNREDGVRDRLFRALKSGVRVGTCVPVLCELECYMQLSSGRKHNEFLFNHLVKSVRIWPMDRTTAQIYGEIFAELNKKGRVRSQVDIMLAALARQMNLILVTADRDFEALPDIRCENWLTA